MKDEKFRTDLNMVSKDSNKKRKPSKTKSAMSIQEELASNYNDLEVSSYDDVNIENINDDIVGEEGYGGRRTLGEVVHFLSTFGVTITILVALGSTVGGLLLGCFAGIIWNMATDSIKDLFLTVTDKSQKIVEQSEELNENYFEEVSKSDIEDDAGQPKSLTKSTLRNLMTEPNKAPDLKSVNTLMKTMSSNGKGYDYLNNSAEVKFLMKEVASVAKTFSKITDDNAKELEKLHQGVAQRFHKAFGFTKVGSKGSVDIMASNSMAPTITVMMPFDSNETTASKFFTFKTRKVAQDPKVDLDKKNYMTVTQDHDELRKLNNENIAYCKEIEFELRDKKLKEFKEKLLSEVQGINAKAIAEVIKNDKISKETKTIAAKLAKGNTDIIGFALKFSGVHGKASVDVAQGAFDFINDTGTLY